MPPNFHYSSFPPLLLRCFSAHSLLTTSRVQALSLRSGPAPRLEHFTVNRGDQSSAPETKLSWRGPYLRRNWSWSIYILASILQCSCPGVIARSNRNCFYYLYPAVLTPTCCWYQLDISQNTLNPIKMVKFMQNSHWFFLSFYFPFNFFHNYLIVKI